MEVQDVGYNKAYDIIYVFNLDESQVRWNKTKNQCDRANIDCIRFSAVNGYNINITNSFNGKNFTGEEFKAKYNKTSTGASYSITCDPECASPTIFAHKSKWPMSVGELGLICTNIKSWKDVLKNNYSTAIFFEDDIKIKNHEKFAEQLDVFLTALPETFDLGFLSIAGYKPKPVKAPFQKLKSNIKGYGAWAVALSQKGVKKLLSYTSYDKPIDLFFLEKIDNSLKSNGSFKSLDTYLSTVSMFEIPPVGQDSIIDSMGRKI